MLHVRQMVDAHTGGNVFLDSSALFLGACKERTCELAMVVRRMSRGSRGNENFGGSFLSPPCSSFWLESI